MIRRILWLHILSHWVLGARINLNCGHRTHNLIVDAALFQQSWTLVRQVSLTGRCQKAARAFDRALVWIPGQYWQH